MAGTFTKELNTRPAQELEEPMEEPGEGGGGSGSPRLWVELCPPPRRYAEVLTPRVSARDLIWRWGRCRSYLVISCGDKMKSC